MSVGNAQFSESYYTEENGEIVSAISVIYVQVDLTGNLDEILKAALDTPTVPQPGQSFGTTAPQVQVIRRIPRMVNFRAATNNNLVRIDIDFQLRRADTDLALRGGATLNTIKVQQDASGDPLQVTYKGDVQRGELTIPAIFNHFSRTITQGTDDPEAVVAAYIGAVNSLAWKGGTPRQWLCTNVEYALKDRTKTPKTYDFTFEFEKTPDPEGHVYTLTYKDDKGNIPADATIENDTPSPGGIKWFEVHPLVDFNALFT